MLDRVGQQIGHYTILQLLGRGGFAEVYLGEHHYLKSQAAIKILQTQLSCQDDLESFLREAQTIARLSHPNIIRVLDFGVDGETPYLVMDYAPNGTLRQHCPKNTPVVFPTIIPYVKQVADALQYAHDEHLIHRDVKPENMLLGRRNEVLLSDFGIALVSQSSRSQRTQDVIGTVAYMSPEQIQGKPRPASDQYSLAVVVYEWLSGDRPFHGSFTEMCAQQMFAPPPPLREKLVQIAPEVERVVMKALNKDPKQRYERIQHFAQELEQACQSGLTVHNSTGPTSNASYTNSVSAGIENAFGSPPAQHSEIPPVPPSVPAASQRYGQFNTNSTPVKPPFPTQQPPYAGASHTQVQQSRQSVQHSPEDHAYQAKQYYPQLPQYERSESQLPHMPNNPEQQKQGMLNLSAPYGAATADQQRTASPESTGNARESWDILGEWKWHILATIIGIILTIALHSFRIVLWNHNTSLTLAIPLFFGAAFGPWVGLLVGVIGWLCSSFLYPSQKLLFLAMFRGAYTWWLPLLLVGGIGFVAGLSMLKKRKYPTISSSMRACILTAIALACCISFILNQAHLLRLFPQIGITALLNIGIGFVSLVIYSIVVRLIDTF